MPKAIIRFDYKHYVVDADDALRVANMLMNAECYEKRGYGQDAAHYVYPCDKGEFDVTLISDERYRMAKLAGEPPARD